MGYRYYEFLTALVSMILLGLPAGMIGSVLPLLIRKLAGESSGLGQKVGQLLTWNTLGAVVGVLITGFILMPTFGLRGSFAILATALSAVGILLAWKRAQKTLALSALCTVAVLGILFGVTGENWRHTISSGAFRSRELEPNSDVLAYRKAHITIDFYEDAPDATVSVEHGDGVATPADVGLRINGKPDASSRGDLCTQTLVGLLPLIARPDSKDVFLLGMGSGITGGAILGHPIEHLVVAENCEPVVRAAKYFEKWNGGVLTDPRTHIWVEDARTILKLSPQRYDIIITQPSNPWMVGVGSVFSLEYYELGARRLKDGGIMAQWFHLYDMHDGIVALVLRTFGKVFPYVEIWDCGVGDIVLLGSKKPWDDSAQHYQQLFEGGRTRLSLEGIGIRSVSELLARQFASQRTGFAITGDGPIQSDLFPVLEYEAPRAFYLGISASTLNEFDERTWQQDIASPAKRSALAALDGAQLRSVFGQFRTINTNLQSYLVWRLRHDALALGGPEPFDIQALPCVFRATNAAPLRALPPPAGTKEEIKNLVAATALVEERSPRSAEGVDAIERLLRQRDTDSDWSASHYAILAARSALGQGSRDKARQVVDLGLKFSPQERQLQYLSRILDREQPDAFRLSATQSGPQ